MVYAGLRYGGYVGSWMVESSAGMDESGVDWASVLDDAAIADDYEGAAVGEGSGYIDSAVEVEGSSSVDEEDAG